MLLLDEILGVGDDFLVAGVTISAESLFAESGGIPAHIGVEYLAQACGALAGMLALDAGQPVRIGFLMGARSVNLYRSWYAFGERLSVTVRMIYQDEATAALEGRIEIGGTLVAEAQLTVYQPPDGAV